MADMVFGVDRPSKYHCHANKHDPITQTTTSPHSWRGSGITEYLRNGGSLETAQEIAAHESSRTTTLYDRSQGEITLDEIERIPAV